ncbi:MAG TPA: replicative DNA helicase [Acidobacteriaceae bacterium]|nr:replicative DNA helicase [Acidobacteriaceae bacterium]
MPLSLTPESDKGLPADVDAERAILGSILTDNAAYSEAAEKIVADDFSLDSHRIIFLHCGRLLDANHAVDVVTLSASLETRGELPAVGGRAYLFSLTENLPRHLNVAEYVRIVKDKAILRRAMGIFASGVARAQAQGEQALDIIHDADAALTELSQLGKERGFVTPVEIIRESWPSVDVMISGDTEQGLPTGFSDYDRMTGGLQEGELTILGARPSMGKTALALNIAEHVAFHENKAVAIFSMEMPAKSLLRRMMASQGRVSMSRMKGGFIGRQERASLDNALKTIVDRSQNVHIDDSGVITVAEIRAKLRRLHARVPLSLIVVDYLQLISTHGTVENRNQEIGKLSRGLKQITLEMKIPVLCLSQLSRATEKRNDRRPVLSDLRDSGSIEQDADVVAFIHRESYYRREEQVSDEERAASEIIIAKQRNGPIGTVKLNYIERFTRFENPA